MNNCKEYRGDVAAITAVPFSDIAIGATTWQVTPTINSENFNPTLTEAITIGVKAATPGGYLIPVVRDSSSIKDDENDSVAGRLHTVAVKCDVDDRDSEVWDYLFTLERTPFHLLLTFRDGQRGFVQATEDTYTCEVTREDNKTSISLTIRNLMGMQLIV